MKRLTIGAAIVLVLLVGLVTLASSTQDVLNLIAQLPFSTADKNFLSSSFQQGLKDGRLTPDQAIELLQKVGLQNSAPIEQRKDVLVTIGQALVAGLPVEMLVSKAEEGVAKGVPMSEILKDVQERKTTLTQVKALFDKRQIRSSKADRASPYSQASIDAAITDVASTLEDYVRSGNNPNDGSAVKDTVVRALERDGRLSANLVKLINERLSEIDLGTIAQAIAKRL